MKIVLLGYMGSGKSAIGKTLSELKGLTFIDLDDYIEEQEEMTISEIFESKGEIYFRKKEGAYLIEIIENYNNLILSVGGGTPCYGQNMDVIKKNTRSIYLNATIPTLAVRLNNEKNKRPLIASFNSQELNEFIAKHLFERRAYYEQADYVVKVSDKGITDICGEINLLLK